MCAAIFRLRANPCPGHLSETIALASIQSFARKPVYFRVTGTLNFPR